MDLGEAMNMRTVTDFPRNEAGLVDKFIGTAYDVVKRVYDSLDIVEKVGINIDNVNTVAEAITEINALYAKLEDLQKIVDNLDDLKIIADGMNQILMIYASLEEILYVYNLVKDKGFMITVTSEAELTAVNSAEVKYTRIVTELADGHGYVDYAFIEGTTAGIPAHDSTTGSWIAIGSSNNMLNLNNAVIVYNGGAAIGGETSITITEAPAAVSAIYINGLRKQPGIHYTYSPSTHVITLATALAQDDEVIIIATGIVIEGTSTLYDLLKSSAGAGVVKTTQGTSVQEQLDALNQNHGSPVIMTLVNAKAFTGFLPGQVIFLSDVGYNFKFNPSRNIIPGHDTSAISADDELHKLVTSGGMLEFADYEKLPSVEAKNYAEYQARFRAKQPIGMVAYGDSITFGLRPDGGQYANNYPTVIAETLSALTGITFTSQNKAFSGDRTLTNYIRNIADGSTGHITTIMLGVNDVLYATNNGETPENISGNTLYGTQSYETILRKFVARELLRGRCVVILGGTQFVSSNLGPMGGFTAPYLARAYDAVAKNVAGQFGCGFVDTRRDIIQQFGISESCHDGIHLRTDFLTIIGKRFSAFFMNQDYKNPCILRDGSVFIPNWLHNPISSSKVISRNTFINGSSPGLGGAADNPESVGFMLFNDDVGGSITLAFYLDYDNAVIYPSINSDGSQYSFNLILDNGATQPNYPSNVEIIPILRNREYILSGRAISGNTQKNRSTERYSQITTGCYMHVTTRGWHMITFASGQNAGVAAVEGLVCDSWSNVRNNDVFGGVSGTVLRSGDTNTLSGFVTGCTTSVTGEFNVSISNLVVDNYRVHVEHTEDSTFIHYQMIYKDANSFRIQFYNADGVLVNPTSFKATVLGGR